MDGALGNGRDFKWGAGKYLGELWNATHEIQSSQCCEECKKKHPDTEMFDFRMTGNAGHPENVCRFMKRKSPEGRPATGPFGVFSGVCPNYSGNTVRGAVGQGRGIQF